MLCHYAKLKKFRELTTMEDPHPSNHTLFPPPPSIPTSNFPMLYYGLVVVGTATVVLALYNLIIIRWCTDVSDQRSRRRGINGPRPTSSRSFHNLDLDSFIYSFKYKKDKAAEDEGNEFECVVCLSVFEEGEELRQLPKCKHSFHAPCIDMWLYSHMDCPLCRSSVEPPGRQRCAVNEQSEHSREGLLGPAALV